MPAEFDHTPLVTDCIMGMLNKYNSGITQDQFYAMNIIDTTDVTEDDVRSVNREVIAFCRENGCYAALPPFEEGAFIDQISSLESSGYSRRLLFNPIRSLSNYFCIK